MNIDRTPKPEMWPHVEQTISIQTDQPFTARFEELNKVTRQAILKNMTAKLFEPNPLLDDYKPTPLTWRDKFNIYRDRVRDAWAVLLGRVEIGDGW